MQDNRCPNCENDLTDTVTTSVITMLQTGERRPRAVACPHCGESLIVSARVVTTLEREVAEAAF